MADILLSVGLQSGSAEFNAFISGLQSQINSVNNGKGTEIKFKPVVDAAGFNAIKDQLASINTMVGELSKKDFRINVQLDNSQQMKDQLGTYQERVRNYVRDVQDAYAAIGRISKSNAFRDMGADALKYTAPAAEAIQKYGASLEKLESRLDKTQSFAGAGRIAEDAREMYEAIRPLIELASSKGVINTGEGFLSFPDMKSATTGISDATSGVQALIQALGLVPQQAQQAAQATKAISTETASIGDASSQYTAHTQAVQAAASAETSKASASKNVAGALKEEAAATKEATAAAESDEKAGKKKEQRLLAIENLYKQVENAQRNWSKAANGDASGSYSGLQGILDELDQLRAKVEDPAIETDLVRLRRQFVEFDRDIGNAGDRSKAFTMGLSNLESRLAYMFSIGNVIMLATRKIKEMAKTTIELDSAMTQLRVVTNASESDYTNYGKSVAGTAKEIGASITDLIDSTTVYARLGYTLEESSNLAKYTAMLSNVGDIDVSTAQDSLTAITKAFKDVTADNIQVAMDKMVAVGNNFPISVSQIAEGMNNAGSALAAAGNSFEESVALLTAANTTVQNVSKSSTGLRTITARIRGTKLELDELGETIEEAKYQEALDLLTGKNVKLTENGEFRSTYEILKDIASVWDSLTSMQQANIAEQLAGKICCCCPSAPKRCA